MPQLLQQLVTESAARSPDRAAVELGADRLTYAELDAVTDRLAGLLARGGVAPGDRVGFWMPKTVSSIVSIVGILKAGAVYVPLDPDAPPARIAYIAANCGVRALLTVGSRLSSVPAVLSAASAVEFVVVMDGDAPDRSAPGVLLYSRADVDAADPADAPAGPPVGPDDLAYILYTSGSTGTPKGVMISHRTSMTFVEWAHRTIGVDASDRLSNHAPFHFDLSIFDVFVAFKAGATLVLVPPGLSAFPYRQAEWIDAERITVWYSVPSALTMMVRQGDLGRLGFEALRTVLYAGEVFPVKYLRDLMTAVPRAEYYNLYGPTETNVITYYQTPVLDPRRTAPVPIGRPCNGYDVFALAPDGGVVDRPGVRGELYAAGPCVARGYWGDAEKTAKHFVPHPLRPDSGEIAYATGDQVELDDNGDFVFFGRRDDMIKSRGYRIELAEIEQVIYGHARVREAAVVAIPDELIGNRIAAFVVMEGGGEDDGAELRRFCLERLPKYMVPELVEFRRVLPKTSTGKIDKKILADEGPER